jgi:hypothetical protein
MQTLISRHAPRPTPVKEKAVQATWQRVILLLVLGYEGLGCLSGGLMLIAAPDGAMMKMPVDMMHGTFSNFLIPGIILFLLGILNTFAFFAVLRRTRADWMLASITSIAMIGWFWIEIAVLQHLHWLHAMWGLPVLAGAVMALALVPANYRQKALLFCGILSSVLYFTINIIVPLQWPGYSLLSHVPSELSAVGAPTRAFWSILATPYTFLMLAFAWGVYKAAGDNKRLALAAKFLLAYAALGFLWPFAPMHLRETLAAGGSTFSDTMHMVLGGATEIFYLLALGYAAAALGKNFRLYSIVTFVLVFVFAVLTFREAPGVARNEPTPYIGLWERINIGLFLLWVVVLSILLLRKQNRKEHPAINQQETRGEERIIQNREVHLPG